MSRPGNQVNNLAWPLPTGVVTEGEVTRLAWDDGALVSWDDGVAVAFPDELAFDLMDSEGYYLVDDSEARLRAA